MLAACFLVAGCKKVNVNELKYQDGYEASLTSELVFSPAHQTDYDLEEKLKRENEILAIRQQTKFGKDERSKFLDYYAFAQKNSDIKTDFISYEEGHYSLHSARPVRFFPAANATKFNGICSVKSYSVETVNVKGKSKTEGRWDGPFYGIVGSVAPTSKPWTKLYVKEFQQSCRERIDMEYWFKAETIEKASLAAELSELVINTARSDGLLPFSIYCDELLFPKTQNGAQVDMSRCKDKVRYSLARINPRSIVDLKDCKNEEIESICLDIRFPKATRNLYIRSDQWGLKIKAYFPDRDIHEMPIIESVILSDLIINI